jgi:lipid-A-disaccharide synthase
MLMPGSRRSEVRLLLPDLLQAAAQLKGDGWQVALLQAPTVDRAFLEQVAGGPLPVPLIAGDTYNLLAAADAGLIASGTATLEAALLGCPPVIVYRFSWFTYVLAKLVIGRRTMGLPNVVLGRRAFPELLQREVRPAELVRAVAELQARRPQLEAAVAELRTKMGPAGASQRAADLVLELLP